MPNDWPKQRFTWCNTRDIEAVAASRIVVAMNPALHVRRLNRSTALVPCLILWCGLAQTPAHAAGGDAWSEPGPHVVSTADSDWTDAARQRTLPVRWHVPAATATGLRPTIVYSHGLGGSRTGGERWARHWASHGFIVLQLQHPGSDESLWRNRGALSVKEALLAGFTPAAYVDRVADVRFAVDELARRAASGDAVAARVDATRLGMSGHSFGARTTLAIAGERIPGMPGTHAAADPRFKAAVALSPTAPGAAADWPARFGDIRIPVLSITGTRDGDPFGKGTPALRTEPWRNMPPPHKFLLVLDDADHYVFGGSDLPRRRSAANDAPIQRFTSMATLAFWLAWLDDNAAARAWLDGPGMRNAVAGAGTWAAK